MVVKRDFTFEEWNVLLHLYRHEKVPLMDEVARKFHEFGVTVGTAGDLSTAGRTLVEHELLMERRNRLTP